MSSIHDDPSYLSAHSPNPSNNGSNETFIDPSPIAPSSNGTEFTDLDEVVERRNGNTIGTLSNEMGRQDEPIQQLELTVRQSNPITIAASAGLHAPVQIKTSPPSRLVPSRPRSDEDEPPRSVIHVPPGFSDFV